MNERERLLQKIKRVQALALHGVGGEKESAAAMLDKLMKQHGISESDIAEERREIAWFRFKTPLEEKLLVQVMYSVVGDRGVYERKNRNTKKKYKMEGVECTPAERLEIELFSGVWESLKSIASGVLNGIIGLINGVISGLNKLKIPDWVPGIGGKGINIPLIPTFAKGTKNTPDTFIAGEAGAELVTNARNRTVFNAAETGSIFRNLANTVNTIRAGVGIPSLQLAYAGATAPSVAAPSVAAGARQSSIVVHSAPVFHVGSEAQAEDIEELLRKHDEELLDKIDEKQRQQEDDERRRQYD